MTRPLEGRTALVTGATQGIGHATAERLAAAGCNIVLIGFGARDAIDAQRTGLASDHGVRVVYAPADVGTPAQVTGAVADAIGVFGGVDILVNNAVVRHSAPIEHFPAEAWDESVAVNLSSAFHAIKAVLPRMKARGWGRIINMSSIYGQRGAANRVGYVTTKTALIGLTRAVALETAAHGVTCNAVCPGTTSTPVHEAAVAALIEGGAAREAAEQTVLRGKQPTGRLIPAEHVAALVEFLCSPEAAHITGAVLPIDGGWSGS
jgi:3-hydroxybutyrate dehydrogenase